MAKKKKKIQLIEHVGKQDLISGKKFHIYIIVISITYMRGIKRPYM